MVTYAKVILIVGFCTAFAIGGLFATTDVGAALNLSDAASLSTNNTYTGTINSFTKGISIGVQDLGGVTYFNGSIVNSTTDSSGNGIAVTFGDDVRIDGKIHRGATAGNTDTRPVWINDNVRVDGDVKQGKTNQGLAKAGAVIGDDGVIVRSFDNTADSSLSVTSVKTGTGIYTLTFESKVDDRYILLSPGGTEAAPTAISGDTSNNIVVVYIADVVAGALVDQAFNIVVF